MNGNAGGVSITLALLHAIPTGSQAPRRFVASAMRLATSSPVLRWFV
jgi:hypothetical protein